MNLYPAIRAKLGTWEYFIVKMTARELDESVNFAYQIYDDITLDDAIQRVLKESRVRDEIIEYLKRQPNRFFSAIVIAAIEGNPKFYPVQVTEDPQFAIFRDSPRINDTFGVLVFDGTQKYYALDGQHRLAAIKTLLDRTNHLSDGAPENFAEEEFSVIVVKPRPDDTKETFMKKYRRLFGNLNRYAKPTDNATNIIMDEDDAIAIITRRLISEHPFFKSAGRHRDSIKVETKAGKNIKKNQVHFTNIETLYDVNISLLNSESRKNTGWGSSEGKTEDFDQFIRFRPSDDYIDNLYQELALYWDAILIEIPDLYNDPVKMRNHDLAEKDNGEGDDHLLFWPIGQLMLANIVRVMLNRRQPDPDRPTESTVKNAIRGLGKVEWRLHKLPWKNFILIKDENKGLPGLLCIN